MATLENGDVVRMRLGGTCQVCRKLGEGGQGVVYEVDYNGKKMALKWYFGEKLKNAQAFYQNLEDNIEKGAPNEAFLWPQELTEQQEGSFGYVMELRPPQYEDFQKFLLAKVKFPSIKPLIEAGLNIVAGFRALHSRGYGYQDLNDGNFFINPQTGDVLICDNDNVAPYGENLGIGGKCRYMAPEIVLRKKNPDVNTDKFSLAVVLYLLLFMNHPLEGLKTSAPACMTEEMEYRFYGSEPVFMYDPTDDSNRPVMGTHTNAIRRWPIFPPYVRETFVRAFTKESMAGRAPRVIEKEWQEMFTRMRDELVVCESCGEETFLTKDGCACISCGRPVRAAYYLQTPGYSIPLARGKSLYACHTDPDSEDFHTVTAQIQVKKDDPRMVRLKNVSNFSWICIDGQGNQAVARPGEAVLASKDLTINIGNTKLKIQ